MARAFALMFDLGLRLAAPIAIGVIAGAALDGVLSTRPLLLFLGVLLGVAIAFYALYDVSRTYGDRNRQ
jgi:F0F1-type ATP synthase assembly protein I